MKRILQKVTSILLALLMVVNMTAVAGAASSGVSGLGGSKRSDAAAHSGLCYMAFLCGF